MKKFLLLLNLLSIGFLSCQKEKAQTNVDAQCLSLSNATMMAEGKLSFVKEGNSGVVKIYRQPNGKYLLGLEEMSLSTATALYIYLSPTKTVSPLSLKICSVLSLYGNIFQSLPSNIDVSVFKYVIIQTERSDEFVASAELN